MSSTSIQSTSVRGVMTPRTARSPRRITPAIILRSSVSITPAVSASAMMVLISSSVTALSDSVLWPSETEDQLGRGIEQPDDGSTDPGDQRHERRDGTGDPLGVLQRQVLGHEFAHHDGEIGDGTDHEAVAERFGGALGHALGEQDLGEAVAERRAGEGAGQDADKGDADLDRRQEPSGILGQPEGGGSARASAVGHRLQAGLAGRDDGQFGQREETVQADQKDGYAEFEHGVFRCSGHRSEVVNVAAAGFCTKRVIR